MISRNDESTIEQTVRSVVNQEIDVRFEVIVVTSGTDRTADIVSERFPDVRLIALERPALPGEARNAGVRAARGDYVSFPGSHVELPSGSLMARIRAHERGYPMVTGVILNGTLTRSGWASYFLDHSNSLPGCPSAELSEPPAHCSYDRRILLESGLFPENVRAGEDTAVNVRLWKEGFRAYRDNGIRLIHRSPCRNPWQLVRHHLIRGRALGRMIAEHGSGVASLIRYLPARLSRISENVEKWGDEVSHEYERHRGLVMLGATAAWLGACSEWIRRSLGKSGIKEMPNDSNG